MCYFKKKKPSFIPLLDDASALPCEVIKVHLQEETNRSHVYLVLRRANVNHNEFKMEALDFVDCGD